MRIAAVQAGSGYGKSVLATEVAIALALPAATVVLEPRDDDPAQLVARFRAALRRVGWSDLAASLTDGDPADAVDGLLDALARDSEPRLVIVDDVHHASVSAPLLGRLITGLPRPHRILVLGRRLPSLVEEVVVGAGAVPLGVDDLAFTTDEVRALYASFGVELAEYDADALRRGTAGWAAALVLAWPRLARGEDVASEVEAIAAQGAVLTHLIRRQLDDLEPALRDGALQAAHLPLLSEPVADAATETPGLFAGLLGEGLPLSAGRDGWYELPGPVQEYLAGLEQLRPDVARRAARVYVERGETVAALQVLLAAGLDLDTAELIAGLTVPRLEQLDYLDLAAAVGGLSPQAVQDHPRVLLALAHSCEGGGHFSVRADALSRAQGILERDGDPALLREVQAEIARDLVRDGQPDEAEALATGVLGEAGPGELAARARALDVQGRAKAWRRDSQSLNDALPLLEEAYRLCLTLGRKSWAAQVVGPLATSVLQAVGRLDDAVDRYTSVLSILPGRSRHRAVILTFCAAVLHDLGRYDEAAAMLSEAKQLARVLSHPFGGAYASWETARGASQQGDATTVITELENAERQSGDWFAHWTGAEFLAEAADCLDRVGETERAWTYLERALARVDESPVGVRRGQGAVLARTGDPEEAERVLEAVSREPRLTPAEAWRVTLLRAYAAHRRGDPAAGQLRAQAFDAAAALGYPDLPLIREHAVAEELLGEAPGTRSPEPAGVHVLGRFEVLRGGRPVAIPPGRPARLVKLLAVSGGRVAADEAIEVLWPDVDATTGRGRLRNLLNRLRTAVPELVERDGEQIVLAPARVDAELFDAEAAAAIAAAPEERPGRARAAVGLYAGECLADEPYEDWAVAPRERLRRRYLELLDLLAEDAIDEGDVDGAIRYLDQAIEAEPLDESRYLRSAELLLFQGRRGGAGAFVRRAEAIRAELELPESPRLARLREATRS